jgi:multidrug efflux pump subunit AcrA (membrane-fusion protein)
MSNVEKVENKNAPGTGKKDSPEEKSYMTRFALTLALVAVVGAGFILRHRIAAVFSGSHAEINAAGSLSSEAPKPKKIKYWHDPMDPTDVSDKPGKSRMGMDYVPVYEEEGQTEGVIKIDPSVVQKIGVRTAEAALTPMTSSIRTIGVVTYDETKLAKIQSKVQGWVEKLYVNSTGEKIGKDTILLEIFSPDLLATQDEFILALAYRDSLNKGGHEALGQSGEDLLEASRRRLLLFDVPEHQIAELEKTRKARKTLHIHSSAEGVVIKKDVVEGMQVTPGETLYEVADLSRVWVNVNVYESEISLASIGQEALLSLTAAPGKFFKGRISYIFPFVDPKSRSITVRLEFANPNLALKPDMYGQVVIQTGSARLVVTVPTEAVMRTGERAIVFMDLGEGRFALRKVVIGMENEGRMEIISGVKAGEKVVTSAQFLFDSESKLREAISKMTAAPTAGDKPVEPKAPEPPAKRAPAKPTAPAKDMGGMKMDHSNMPGMDHSQMGK